MSLPVSNRLPEPGRWRRGDALATAPVIRRPVRAPVVPLGPRDDSRAVNAAVRWALYGFVFSIPLEYPGRSIPLEVHTITASLFLLVAMLQPRLCFRRPPAVFYCLAAYLWAWVVLGTFTQHPGETVKLFLNYLLVALVFWVAYHLMHFNGVARRTFLAFVLGCVVVGLMQSFHIMESDVEGRSVVLGQDANMLGGNMALGIVMLLGLTYGGTRRPVWFQAIAAGAALLLCRTLLWTGSRGAAMALVVGLLAFAFRAGDLRKTLRQLMVVVLACLVLTAAVIRNGSLLKRYQDTLSEGDLSGREMIYPEAIHMFEERPLFGWGPIDHFYELGARTVGYQIGKRNADGLAVHAMKETHDLVLEMLTAVGLAGALPLFTCIGICVWAAWKARSGDRGSIPLALVACALVMGLDIDTSASKQFWLILAYAVASAHRARFPAVLAGVISRPTGAGLRMGRYGHRDE